MALENRAQRPPKCPTYSHPHAVQFPETIHPVLLISPALQHINVPDSSRNFLERVLAYKTHAFQIYKNVCFRFQKRYYSTALLIILKCARLQGDSRLGNGFKGRDIVEQKRLMLVIDKADILDSYFVPLKQCLLLRRSDFKIASLEERQMRKCFRDWPASLASGLSQQAAAQLRHNLSASLFNDILDLPSTFIQYSLILNIWRKVKVTFSHVYTAVLPVISYTTLTGSATSLHAPL